MFEYYTTKAWNFSNEKMLNVGTKMNAKEKSYYRIDGEGLDVKAYFIDCIMGVRRNNLKETDDMIPAAKRHLKM